MKVEIKWINGKLFGGRKAIGKFSLPDSLSENEIGEFATKPGSLFLLESSINRQLRHFVNKEVIKIYFYNPLNANVPIKFITTIMVNNTIIIPSQLLVMKMMKITIILINEGK